MLNAQGQAALFFGRFCWRAIQNLALAAWRVSRWLGKGYFHAFVRPASSFRVPRRLVIGLRAACLLAFVACLTYARFYSLRHTNEVFAAFGYRSRHAATSLASFEWLWRQPDVDDYVRKAAAAHGVDEALIHAVIQAESNYRNGAISRTGACGLMQIQPSTVDLLRGGNPFDPRENVFMGTRYLVSLKRQFDGDTRLALAAYNAGPAAVREYKGIPPYPETRQYVQRVMGIYKPQNTRESANKSGGEKKLKR